MSIFKYSNEEKDLNKILKMNQDKSNNLLNDAKIASLRNQSDSNISTAEELLNSLGYVNKISEVKNKKFDEKIYTRLNNRPILKSWDELIDEANNTIEQEVVLEDLLSSDEIDNSFKELESINDNFSKATSIVNKTDLSFLAIATALQVTKTLLFPYISKKLGYGESLDASSRLAHNDKSIEKTHKESNDKFRNSHQKRNKNGYWINLLYQTPAYDITSGSSELGINMGGRYHRLYTLGHDPILGWIFGTANILTDIITLNNFQSYRVTRNPKMKITSEKVSIFNLFDESLKVIQDDFLNLPAAVFAQAQHLKSDIFTKQGLPVPILTMFNENFASKLYKNQYDSLCLARDTKITGASYVVSAIFDIIISLVHSLFRDKDESKDLYEIRTRKILLISNSIATSSSIVSTCITKNPKQLDIGSLLSTTIRLFTDTRFITKIKDEFIQNEIYKKLQVELDEIDRLYKEI